MFLAADVGNTNIVVGIYDGDTLVTSWRLATDQTRMPDEWWAMLTILANIERVDLHTLDGAIVASVVPVLTRAFSEMIQRRLRKAPFIVSTALDLGIRVRVPNPAEVGADRLANALAARSRYGAPAIVIDFGTGTNFDVVSPEGDYIGGAIAPGVAIALQALTSRAARLTAVDIAVPPHAIADNTIQSIQSGTVIGYIGLIEGLVDRMARELRAKPAVIATGGLGRIFEGYTPVIDRYDPNLTLDGLSILYQRLSGQRHDP